MNTEQEEAAVWQSLIKFYIPSHLRAGIVRYVVHGIRPGSFLQLVIACDLGAVVACDDNMSLADLRALYRWFYNEAPSPCWGSLPAMEAWVAGKTKKAEAIA